MVYCTVDTEFGSILECHSSSRSDHVGPDPPWTLYLRSTREELTKAVLGKERGVDDG
jgi:hypothetical protein